MINVDVVVGVAMAVGLVGTVVPLLPGLPLIVGAAFAWVIADGADSGQWLVFGAVTVVAVVGLIVGSILPARRASAAGASRVSLLAGAIGAVAGAIFIPVVGAFIGWPLGVLAAEWLRSRDVGVAVASTRATVAGLVHGAAIQFGAGVVAVAIWVIAVWS
jgi:uncharacterized protein YqgC (DUF456 family)